MLHERNGQLQGIKWIKSLPNLQQFQAPYVLFTAAEAEEHIKKAKHIFSGVNLNTKFALKYRGAFCSEGMGKWYSWMDRELSRLQAVVNNETTIIIPKLLLI